MDVLDASSYRHLIATDRPRPSALEGIVAGVLMSSVLWALIGVAVKLLVGG